MVTTLREPELLVSKNSARGFHYQLHILYTNEQNKQQGHVNIIFFFTFLFSPHDGASYMDSIFFHFFQVLHHL